MSFPCRTSRNGGQHKWSILKFTTVERDEFVQSCRYCGSVRWGKFEMREGQMQKDIHWKFSSGLENSGAESTNPNLVVSDIDNESGFISDK